MAVPVFVDSPNIRVTSRWTNVVGVTVASDQHRTGAYAYKAFDQQYMSRALTQRTDYYMGAAIRIGPNMGWGDVSWGGIVFFEGGHPQMMGIINRSTGRFEIWRCHEWAGGLTYMSALLGYGGTAFINTWYYLELYGLIDDTVGKAHMRVNGYPLITLDNVGTYSGHGTAAINRAVLYTSAATQAFIHWDDIKIWNDAWPGAGGVHVMRVDADGVHTDWSPSAGLDRYACVDEFPPLFDDNCYAPAATPGLKSTFGTLDADFPGLYSNIPVVAACALSRLSESGTGAMRTFLEVSGSEAAGSDVPLDVSGVWVDSYHVVNPNTGMAWTRPGVLAAEVGIETR